jgi:hypothetical protein
MHTTATPRVTPIIEIHVEIDTKKRPELKYLWAIYLSKLIILPILAHTGGVVQFQIYSHVTK